jgi:hypothetical protein
MGDYVLLRKNLSSDKPAFVLAQYMTKKGQENQHKVRILVTPNAYKID